VHSLDSAVDSRPHRRLVRVNCALLACRHCGRLLIASGARHCVDRALRSLGDCARLHIQLALLRIWLSSRQARVDLSRHWSRVQCACRHFHVVVSKRTLTFRRTWWCASQTSCESRHHGQEIRYKLGDKRHHRNPPQTTPQISLQTDECQEWFDVARLRHKWGVPSVRQTRNARRQAHKKSGTQMQELCVSTHLSAVVRCTRGVGTPSGR
jgi:hypothetical protein